MDASRSCKTHLQYLRRLSEGDGARAWPISRVKIWQLISFRCMTSREILFNAGYDSAEHNYNP